MYRERDALFHFQHLFTSTLPSERKPDLHYIRLCTQKLDVTFASFFFSLFSFVCVCVTFDPLLHDICFVFFIFESTEYISKKINKFPISQKRKRKRKKRLWWELMDSRHTSRLTRYRSPTGSARPFLCVFNESLF